MSDKKLNRQIKHQIVIEQEEWDRVVRKILPPNAKLIWVSPRVGDSRVYAFDGKIAKIRSSRVYLPESMKALWEEKEIVGLIQHNLKYSKIDDWECLILDRIPGKSLDKLASGSSPYQRLKILRNVLKELNQIHRKGICHTDLRADNILVSASGQVRVIDFDRANLGTSLDYVLADWLGISRFGISENPYWKLAIFTLFPRIESAGLRIRKLLGLNRKMMPSFPADRELQGLEKAWSAARDARANAPGQYIAYYSFTYKNWHFLGERPWYLRWEPIRNCVDFVDKFVLELGCNMGLFSLFAMAHGARRALGIDKDNEIIEVASLLGKSLGIDANFECVDLGLSPDWEEKLKGADIVIAMSLIHWLPNKERVLKFLGQHREVIYEGHATLSSEILRLNSIGFHHVKVLCETERGRHVLYGMK